MLQAGSPAPAFTLPDADMETFDLAGVRGKNVVLFFYPKDDTPGGTIEAAEFSDHEDEFRRHHCIVVGVSRDDCFTHAEFRDRHGLSVRLLSDSEGEVCRHYRVWQSREVDGVKRMGILRSTFVIDRKGILRHALYGVVPRGHAAEVLELVKQLDRQEAHGHREKNGRQPEVPGVGSGRQSD
ncbi:MAG TPA: peroxiredoxin [Rhodocyclaceae bacterium]|nr:MAG: peroxiredoxin [Betaproteobacteria bacterium CG2_30_68_42]PIV72371.1 MAG: peroxiredoxin [Rhodocyclales bacterium CG17_big_fil_post_rev_8_21_14_2_50_68_7]PIX76355.1 MAG: peroxiredoxin [Rhodocyclales bacterium CG_4_10_14_3_um_filter_68_10]PJA58376.1 MAG: peroxiredoxin [Rhodocyclales bacterium CG_4_9_14_3_um_filter_68_10]HCX33041.1 peroxiredoxin [Rhodocyclaceae bacterium]